MNDQYLAGETSDWQETRLWKQLQDLDTPEAEAVRIRINECMPAIQRVLAQGGTATLDFTLHDSGHAFRVARRMAEIIPSDVLPKLSAYELAMLLLSAYLHDIGMTPERRKVSTHHRYLLTGDRQDLSQDEINEFQKWLDDEGSGIVPPLTQDRTTVEILGLADELTKYYCRYRHNDWSEEWIREHLINQDLGNYVDWADDLVALCCSHHYGYDQIVKDRFSPRPVGSPARIVHLRYLACILRIADVLEFDPERTPDIILRHRDVSASSQIYWWKDHHISMVQDLNRLVLSARPPTAYIHRAVEVTADQVDDELRLCRTLADETHFEKCPGLTDDLPHRWDLLSSMHRAITPKEDTYEYINGAFRPDTNKLLQLLSGVKLYGQELAAVRELLQNAFDAVREQIAYERLSKPNPQDSGLVDVLSKLHRVELRLETSTDGVWLICADTGVGMTKSIIRDHLLVSGTASRHDLLDLERRCKQAGFSLGRTGQFGIGVLSYFMIANRVVIRTRRAQEGGDPEATAWHFETDGIGSFGELRRDTTLAHGTEVRLRLLANVVGSSTSDWYSRLAQYLKATIVSIPCIFQLSSTLPTCESLSLGPGWTQSPDDLLQSSLAELGRFWDSTFDRFPSDLLSNTRQQEREADQRDRDNIKAEIRQHIRWEVTEGELPEGLGRYRIHLPYFALPGGASLAFLRVRSDRGKRLVEKVGPRDGWNPDGELFMSWKGMRIKRSAKDPLVPHVGASFVEVDWRSPTAGDPTVNRAEVTTSRSAKAALQWLDRQASEQARVLMDRSTASPYTLLSNRIIGIEAQFNTPLNWMWIEPSAKGLKAYWGPLVFPCVNQGNLPPRTHRGAIKWKNKEVSVLHTVTVHGMDRFGLIGRFNWNSANTPPDRIVVGKDISKGPKGVKPVPLWERKPRQKSAPAVGLTCRFPPKWPSVIGVTVSGYAGGFMRATIWNPTHPILKAVDASSVEWASKSFMKNLDPLPLKAEILKHRGRAASWFMRCLEETRSAKDLWDGLKDRDPQFLKELWMLLFVSDKSRRPRSAISVCHWLGEGAWNGDIAIVTSDEWSYCDSSQRQHQEMYMPDPGPEWCVNV